MVEFYFFWNRDVLLLVKVSKCICKYYVVLEYLENTAGKFENLSALKLTRILVLVGGYVVDFHLLVYTNEIHFDVILSERLIMQFFLI